MELKEYYNQDIFKIFFQFCSYKTFVIVCSVALKDFKDFKKSWLGVLNQQVNFLF